MHLGMQYNPKLQANIHFVKVIYPKWHKFWSKVIDDNEHSLLVDWINYSMSGSRVLFS